MYTAAEICEARDVLCGVCENRNCETCKVAALVNEALQEAEQDN